MSNEPTWRVVATLLTNDGKGAGGSHALGTTFLSREEAESWLRTRAHKLSVRHAYRVRRLYP